MLTEDEIKATVFVVLPTGEVLASRDDFAKFHTVFTSNTVREEYVNLLGAAGMLFNTLDAIEVGLEELVTLLEKHGADLAAAPVVSMIAASKTARAAAIEGLPSLAHRFGKKDGDAEK